MLRNYLKIALRHLWNHRGYAFINVAGLAVGMACCLLIVLFIQEELRYDRYHERADAIYRVTLDLKVPGAAFQIATTMAPLGPALVDGMPEVTQAARISRPRERLIAQGDRRFYEEGFYFADATLFDVFSYPFLRGDPQTALAEPFSVVLTEETARKYFGEADPLGQVLRVDETYEFTVSGVLASLPSYTHFKFDFLASFASLGAMPLDGLESWGNVTDVHTYVVIPGHDAARVEGKLSGFLQTYLDEGDQAAITLHLQPLTRIRLHSDLSNEDGDVGNLTTLYVFASIALLILLIAAINFINLATARATRRAREVGVRKVLGAFRTQLIRQFLGESLLLAGLALGLALVLAQALLPLFNTLLEKNLAANYGANGVLLLALAGITLFIGVVAGSYPAFVLSGFRPVAVLKGRAQQGRGEALFRKGLVVVQFTIAIVLIIGSVVIAAQMTYLGEKDLGFESEQVVVVPLRDEALQGRYEPFKRTIVQHPNVVRAAAASFLPGMNSYSFTSYLPDGAADDEAMGFRTIFIDADLVETLGFDLVAGRTFSEDIPTDTASALLLNEAAVRLLGWDDPLGKTLATDEQDLRVVGVLRDVHYSSLDQEIEPIVFRFAPDTFQHLAVRILPRDVPETLAFLKEAWGTVAPAYPFEYTFLDEHFGSSYADAQRLGKTIRTFTVLAIFVACLGLFGLAAYTTQQRTKEIGIRKVLGASVPGILLLLSREFLALMALAFAAAAPLAYLGMQQWLNDFAYRIDLSGWIFLLAGILTFVIALLTVSYQAIKAALADPVESLRYE